MADRKRDSPFNPDTFSLTKGTGEMDNDTIEENDDKDPERMHSVNDQGQATGGSVKREENPFSFRHFLNKEVATPFSNTGARPKTYTSKNKGDDDNLSSRDESQNTSSSTRTSRSQRISATPDYASALPDFVQDHLILEQSLMHNGAPPRSCSLDLENLPDFTIITDNHSHNESGHSNLRDNNHPNDTEDSVPLHLPNFEMVNHQGNIPLDLPLNLSDQNDPANDIIGPQRLPDFLSDGPLHSGHHGDNSPGNRDSLQVDYAPNQQNDYIVQVVELREENNSLRREFDEERRLYHSELRKVERLTRQMAKESKDTLAMEELIEKVEENLRNTTARAVEAENTVTKQSKEIKDLQMQLSLLRIENDELMQGLGSRCQNDEVFNEQIVEQIRTAATGAEQKLRQLLQGVENLKLVASTLESAHKFKENQDPHKHS